MIIVEVKIVELVGSSFLTIDTVRNTNGGCKLGQHRNGQTTLMQYNDYIPFMDSGEGLRIDVASRDNPVPLRRANFYAFCQSNKNPNFKPRLLAFVTSVELERAMKNCPTRTDRHDVCYKSVLLPQII